MDIRISSLQTRSKWKSWKLGKITSQENLGRPQESVLAYSECIIRYNIQTHQYQQQNLSRWLTHSSLTHSLSLSLSLSLTYVRTYTHTYIYTHTPLLFALFLDHNPLVRTTLDIVTKQVTQSFAICSLWMTWKSPFKKTTNWKNLLCMDFDDIKIESMPMLLST